MDFLKTTSYKWMFLLLALFCLKMGSPSTIQGSLNLAATLLSYSSVPGLRKCRQLWPAFSSRGQSHKFPQGWQQRILFSYWKEILSYLDLFARLVTRTQTRVIWEKGITMKKMPPSRLACGQAFEGFSFLPFMYLFIYLPTYPFVYKTGCPYVALTIVDLTM